MTRLLLTLLATLAAFAGWLIASGRIRINTATGRPDLVPSRGQGLRLIEETARNKARPARINVEPSPWIGEVR